MKKIEIYDCDYEALEAMAEDEDISTAELIADILEAYKGLAD
ncbi:MAG: ribbon-helix-helix protein, CopG family [Lachnospiraceae bacterium]|nr:ribbon-helix-helix protein, CopG family [Lachnospiraceae bacterium]